MTYGGLCDYLISTDSHVHLQVCVWDSLPRHDTDSQKMTDLTECCQRVGLTLLTCRQQTQMSVIWGVKPTDTNPSIARQDDLC
jgi:hypothetical protein